VECAHIKADVPLLVPPSEVPSADPRNTGTMPPSRPPAACRLRLEPTLFAAPRFVPGCKPAVDRRALTTR